ncbi:MAG: glucoamylase family protein [Oscillospiraceae bacterium]|nr:glucoamylase family protein [Oscillospiraceae bacterium]
MNERKWEGNMEEERFGQFARETARALIPDGRKSGAFMARKGRRHLRIIKECRLRAASYAAGRDRVPEEVEWLLDNWYLAEQEGKTAVEALAGAGALRASRDQSHKRVLLIDSLADALLKSGQVVTGTSVALFLKRAQDRLPLSEKELCLFLCALRLAVLREIASVCKSLMRMMEEERQKKGVFAAENQVRHLQEGGAAPAEKQIALAEQAVRLHCRMSSRMERAFTVLRALSTTDFSEGLEEASVVEQILKEDPAGIYKDLDEKSRSWYRQALCRLAKRKKVSEQDIARQLIDLAQKGAGEERHVGYYLFVRPLGQPARKRSGMFYVGGIVLVALFLTLLTGFLLQNWLAALLIVFPVFELVKNTADFIVLHTVRPRPVFRLDLKEGVPKEGKTLCVISALLTDEKAGETLAARLEQYRLANRDAGAELSFGLLADLPDSRTPMGSKERKWVEVARRALEDLNKKYGGGFYLLFRQPSFHPVDERYMGWERKRGALVELMRLLKNRGTNLEVLSGDKESLHGTRYVITLDEDTTLNVGAARELIGAMLHPLNRPKIDPRKRIVISGYGILQPRISVSLEAANKSQFSRIFAGQGGVDPYGSATSDVYHDLFNQGIYTGKGILDVEAFYFCLNRRFPENTILSHDLLEGAYLRVGLIGDVELTDIYPYKVTSYFSRLHRWIRGDWQVASWLRRVVKTPDGREKNPISPIHKWEIWDNLRRSVTPIFTFIALLLGMIFSQRVFAAAAGAAILSAVSHLLLSGADLAFRRGAGMRARYHSTIITGFGGVVLQTLVQLLFLPYHAYISLSAICQAQYRIRISHKNMLSWVTAADAERTTKNGVGAVYWTMAPGVICGVAAIVFSQYPVGSAVGLVWALSPLFAWAMSRVLDRRRALGSADRAFLLHEATLIWRYFADFLRPEDHYLPPDNFQEQPAAGLARRTSPTNIGMAMLCALAALDLDLAPQERVLDLIDHTLSTVERLEKWNGHLCNWYDTATLAPLRPKYVSTVDSGNLYGCLVALREGLEELGEDGAPICRRISRFLAEMNFQPLYDKQRRLFTIGYDLEKQELTKGWYDLMASEARQTSYIAVATGQVEARHWRRLSRALVSENHYSGIASWTGTMFEYLMPNLLLPCYQNSLLYESAGFCVYVQKKRTAGRGVPWGISESAFYAFDGALNYQYKAHGVQKLALKRGLNRELVISPYSSFLALSVAPESAAANLRHLRNLGLEGKYGLYEAADYTPSRQTGNGKFEAVRTYMAHHLGMSLLSIDNALAGNIMQRRFLRDRSMAAYRELLQEKVPVGAIVMKNPVRDVPERASRAVGEGWRREGKGCDVWRPRCHLLSNGSYSVLTTDAGLSDSSWGAVKLTRFSPRQTGEAMGMSFFIWTGERLLSLSPAPCFGEAEYGHRFDASAAAITAKWEEFSSEVQIRLPENGTGELREVELLYSGVGRREVELVCYFEPVLARRADFEAHPAFSKLSLSTSLEPDGVLISRRPRGEESELYLAFLCSEPGARFDTSREETLGRGGVRALPAALRRPPQGTAGEVLDPCVLARLPLCLEGGEKTKVRFALAAAESRPEAFLTAERLIKLPRGKGVGRLDGSIRLLGLTKEEVLEAFSLLEGLAFPPGRGERRPARAGKTILWAYSVSGDLPILAAKVSTPEQAEKGVRLFLQYRMLAMNGFSCDLVFLASDGGNYRQPLRRRLLEGLKLAGCEGLLGARGGVHLLDPPREDEEAILALASVVVAEGKKEPELPFSMRPCPQEKTPHIAQACVTHTFLEDKSVRFETGSTMPPLAWSHILSNPHFGYLATDAGTGHLWRENARENQLIPWNNDPLAVYGPERLALREGGEEISLFAAGDGYPCTVTYGFGYAVWEKRVGERTLKTTAFVPPRLPVRVLLIEGEGEIRYFARLQMGSEPALAAYVVTGEENGLLEAQNPAHAAFHPQRMFFTASNAFSGFTCDQRSYQSGVLDGKTGSGLLPCFGAAVPFSGRLVLLTGCDTGQTQREEILKLREPDAAERALSDTVAFWKGQIGTLEVQTKNAALDHYLNGWALYQTIACRLWGRSSLYQNGGAFGFRDQLQDACALPAFAPELAKKQILLAASHQFEEGDVQHWWHPEDQSAGADKGVRTRCSDDLLWLPYAACRYVEQTGDMEILKEEAPYLASPVLRGGEGERYETPQASQKTEPLFDHALRALDLAIGRGTGTHGLALMGGGDWNDGMNRVGASGHGESEWLTWFIAHVTERFAGLARRVGDEALSERLIRKAEEYGTAASRAWDGKWFLRGYYDDGRTLGSHADAACKIDSIAQSFGSLSSFADKERVRQGLLSAVQMLFDREHGIVKLFAPPFVERNPDPGYIAGYPAGIRENGGQYTHGAIWLAMGCLREGFCQEGWEILEALLPEQHKETCYKTEPYVLSADVYANPDHVGRGGWSWYTGAAGWYYQVAVEEFLGLQVRDGMLSVNPRIPADWPGYEAVWNGKKGTIRIRVARGEKAALLWDGAPAKENAFPLNEEGAHTLEVILS